MTGRIGVVGSNMVDLVTYVDRMPGVGETLAAPRFEMGAGGKGANQAVAAAKLGSHVVMVSRVGDDVFGQNTLRNFRDLGIDARHVRAVPGVSSGVAPIFVEPSGENRILIVKGANDHLLPADFDEAAEDLLRCDLVLLQLEIPLQTVYHAIAWAARHGREILLNPAPATPDLDLDRVRAAAFLVPNQTELGLLTGLPTVTPEQAEAAARRLIDKGVGTVIVTLGADGALLVGAGPAERIAPVPVTPRDTTGAGDAFIGSFAHHYVQSRDVVDALRWASCYAADSITRPGTQKAFADREAFEAFCRGLGS
jgi:ribokinase